MMANAAAMVILKLSMVRVDVHLRAEIEGKMGTPARNSRGIVRFACNAALTFK